MSRSGAGSRGIPEVLGGKRLKIRKNQKNAPELYGWATAQQYPPGFYAGGSSRTNGSGHPLSVPTVAHPPNFKAIGNLLSVQDAAQGSADFF